MACIAMTIQCVVQILRYAESPAFVENKGSLKNLAWAIDDELILKDAVASAYLGRPVGWHTLWVEGKEGRGYTRNGRNLYDVWHAHAELATQVRCLQSLCLGHRSWQSLCTCESG